MACHLNIVQELPSSPTTFRGFSVLPLQHERLFAAVCCADFVQLSDIRWKIIQQDSHIT